MRPAPVPKNTAATRAAKDMTIECVSNPRMPQADRRLETRLTADAHPYMGQDDEKREDGYEEKKADCVFVLLVGIVLVPLAVGVQKPADET
jgi:hypothetical protein